MYELQREITQLVRRKNGIVLTREIVAKGIPRSYIQIVVKEGKMKKAAHGVYIGVDAIEDDMYIIQSVNALAIYSHETALYLHGLTDRDPLEYIATVPSGYNASKLKSLGVKTHFVKRELHELGVVEKKTYLDRIIRVYDIERTLCDIVRNRNNMDPAILSDALRRYISTKEKNIPKLMRYAKEMKIESVIRVYLEVLL